jgi:hypothetical protein
MSRRQKREQSLNIEKKVEQRGIIQVSTYIKKKKNIYL